MANKRKTLIPPAAPDSEADLAPLTPEEARLIALANPKISTALVEMSARAEAVLRDGPDGNGWLYNELLRPEAEEHAAALRALLVAEITEGDEQ